MAAINCPRWSDFTIDVIANGGKVVGRGGIICPKFGVSISNYDIERLLNRAIAPVESRSEAKPQGGFLVVALLMFGMVFLMIYTVITEPFEWLGFMIFLPMILICGFIGVMTTIGGIEWLRSQFSRK